MEKGYKINAVTGHKFRDGKLSLHITCSNKSETVSRWLSIGVIDDDPIVKEYLRNHKIGKDFDDVAHLKGKKIAEVVGLYDVDKTYSEPIYIVRLEHEAVYTKVASSELQKQCPDRLIDFLESLIDL